MSCAGSAGVRPCGIPSRRGTEKTGGVRRREDGAGVETGRAGHLAEPVAKSTGTGSTLKS